MKCAGRYEEIETAGRRLKKALMERMLGAELSHHLGYAFGGVKPERLPIIATARESRAC